MNYNEKFWKHVNKTSDCWNWIGAKFASNRNMYGMFYAGKHNNVLAHRYSYEQEFGSIPNNLVIDHKCRNGLCVNPSHLEAVTNKENIMRGKGAPARNALKTHCKRGHLLSGNNLYNRKSNHRACKACGNLYNASRKIISGASSEVEH